MSCTKMRSCHATGPDSFIHLALSLAMAQQPALGMNNVTLRQAAGAL
jgi:hypothetical protein